MNGLVRRFQITERKLQNRHPHKKRRYLYRLPQGDIIFAVEHTVQITFAGLDVLD
jgi:hypothetical protein